VVTFGDYEQTQKKKKKRVSHHGLAIYIKKVFYGKRRIYENTNISACKKYNLQKIL